jgi:hypothetical protein
MLKTTEICISSASAGNETFEKCSILFKFKEGENLSADG